MAKWDGALPIQAMKGGHVQNGVLPPPHTLPFLLPISAHSKNTLLWMGNAAQQPPCKTYAAGELHGCPSQENRQTFSAVNFGAQANDSMKASLPSPPQHSNHAGWGGKEDAKENGIAIKSFGWFLHILPSPLFPHHSCHTIRPPVLGRRAHRFTLYAQPPPHHPNCPPLLVVNGRWWVALVCWG